MGKRFLAGFAALTFFLSSGVTDAVAQMLSPDECRVLFARIQRARQVAKSGGVRESAELNAARREEKRLRDEMVQLRCNRRANMDAPHCQKLIAEVQAAAARRQEAEQYRFGSVEQMQAGAAEEAILTQEYEVGGCRGRRAQGPTNLSREERIRRGMPVEPAGPGISDADAAAMGGIMLGIIGFGLGAAAAGVGRGGGGGGRHVPMAPMGGHRR